MATTVTTENRSSTPKAKGKYKKVFQIGGVAALVAGAGIGAYFFYQRWQKSKFVKPVISRAKKSQKKSSRFRCTSSDYPLSFGTCHPDVGILQQYLKKTHKADLGKYGKNRDGIDNKFGNTTKAVALKHLGKTSFTRNDIASMKLALRFT